jgi:hypothetical protein
MKQKLDECYHIQSSQIYVPVTFDLTQKETVNCSAAAVPFLICLKILTFNSLYKSCLRSTAAGDASQLCKVFQDFLNPEPVGASFSTVSSPSS